MGGDRFGGVAFGGFGPGGGQFFGLGGVFDQIDDGVGHGDGVTDGDDQSCFAVLNGLYGSGGASGSDGWGSECYGLD